MFPLYTRWHIYDQNMDWAAAAAASNNVFLTMP